MATPGAARLGQCRPGRLSLLARHFGISTAVSAPLAGRPLDRLGQRRVLVPLAAAFAAALTGLVASVRHTGPVGLAVLAAAAA